ncbi:MAG: hypothetical protein R2719_15045 [Micropruina sp.]
MSDVLEPGLEGPWDFGSFTVTCSRSSRADLVSTLWPVYEESFGPLRVLAAARHVLTQDEFAEELDDPRIWKYIALDREGRPAGLATLADDLSALPWISPEYYAHKYPEETSRRAAFYNGLTSSDRTCAATRYLPGWWPASARAWQRRRGSWLSISVASTIRIARWRR